MQFGGCHNQRMEPRHISLENTLSYVLECAWCIAIRVQGSEVAVGYDKGAPVIKLVRNDT